MFPRQVLRYLYLTVNPFPNSKAFCGCESKLLASFLEMVLMEPAAHRPAAFV